MKLKILKEITGNSHVVHSVSKGFREEEIVRVYVWYAYTYLCHNGVFLK